MSGHAAHRPPASPAAGLCVPARHSTHGAAPPAPAGRKAPGRHAHAAAPVAPAGEVAPGRHAAHGPGPAAGLYVPGGQGMQAAGSAAAGGGGGRAAH